MIQQSFLPYFKPSLPLQDILYEEQPNAKCLCSVNEGTDLGRNHLRRDCLQETVVSSLSMWAAMIECIPIPCALTCAHSKPVIFDLWGLRPSRNQIKAQNTVPQKKNIKSKDHIAGSRISTWHGSQSVSVKTWLQYSQALRVSFKLDQSFQVLHVFAANVHSQNYFEVCETMPLINNK